MNGYYNLSIALQCFDSCMKLTNWLFQSIPRSYYYNTPQISYKQCNFSATCHAMYTNQYQNRKSED